VDCDVGSAGRAIAQDDVYDTVLQAERRHLSRVTELDDFSAWREQLIAELLRPRSSYARAMELTSDASPQPRNPERYAHFLGQWSAMVADTIRRLQRSGVAQDAEPEDIATAILAAIHGGVLLARVSDDSQPLRHALRLSFEHLGPCS
jgi:hypothetical protein